MGCARKEDFYRDAYAIYEKLLLPYSFPGWIRWTEEDSTLQAVWDELFTFSQTCESLSWLDRQEFARFDPEVRCWNRKQKELFRYLIQQLYLGYWTVNAKQPSLFPQRSVLYRIRQTCRGQTAILGWWKSIYRTFLVSLFYLEPYLLQAMLILSAVCAVLFIYAIHSSF